MLFRYFSQLSVPTSVRVQALVARLSAPRLDLNSALQERVEALKDLEAPVQYRLREFNTPQLLSLLRSYALTNQGSPELYAKATIQTMKKLHSLQADQQAEVCYYLARAKQGSGRLFRSVEFAFMRDITKFPPKAVAQLAYAFWATGSQDFYRAAAEVFKANQSSFSTETGLLLLTGLANRKWTESGLQGSLESWVGQVSGPQSLVVQVYHVLLRLQAVETAVLAVEAKLDPEEMDLRTVEHYLGCCVTFSRKVKSEALDQVQCLLEDVDYVALSKLVYTLELVPEASSAKAAIHVFVQTNLHRFSEADFALVASALIHTKSHTPALVSHISTHKFPVSDLLRLLLAAGSQSSPISPLYPQIQESLAGHLFNPSEFVLLVSLLARLQAPSQSLWTAVLKEAVLVDLEDAEQYMQLFAVLQTVTEVDTADARKTLASKYEAK